MTNKYLNCCTSVFNRKCITCVGGNCLVTLNELLKLYSTALIRTFIITYLKFIYLSVYFLQSKTDQLNNYCRVFYFTSWNIDLLSLFKIHK